MTVHILSEDDAQAYLDLGVTANDVVRLRWPDATDEEASYILWELTPFPMRSGILDVADMIASLDADTFPPTKINREGI